MKLCHVFHCPKRGMCLRFTQEPQPKENLISPCCYGWVIPLVKPEREFDCTQFLSFEMLVEKLSTGVKV